MSPRKLESATESYLGDSSYVASLLPAGSWVHPDEHAHLDVKGVPYFHRHGGGAKPHFHIVRFFYDEVGLIVLEPGGRW